MTLLAPVWLMLGAVAALGVLALHFIARQRPSPMTLPTTRFIPDLPARAASRAPRPTDLVLLLLRALAVLLLGLAFAGPLLRPTRAPVVRVVMLDRSGAVAEPVGTQSAATEPVAAAAVDSGAALAASILRDGDVLVPFDTSAHALEWDETEPVPRPNREAPADLATALLVAMREARAISDRADSIELVLISPVDAAAWSPAVLAVRVEWPGAIRVLRTQPAAPDTSVRAIELRSSADDDPLGATVALLGGTAPGRVRIVRDAPTGADSAWVRDSGGALVIWPGVVIPAADSAAARQGAGAVIALDVVAVAPWIRGESAQGRPVAWWADGVPAAAESPFGAGCVREVAIGVPTAGDVALGTSTQRLVRALTLPCGAPVRLGPVSDTLVRQLAGAGGLVSGTLVIRAGAPASPATPWLLAAGVVLLLIEWLARGRLARA